MPLSPAQARYLELRIGVSRRPAPPDADGKAPIPETLILERWRALTTKACDGSTYHGCRLPPASWRLLRAMLDIEPGLARETTERIGEVMTDARATAKRQGEHLGSVPADALRELLRFLGRGQRLQQILEEHAAATRYGVPDLLLYRVRAGRALDFRFIEVKQHGETVREDQVAELEMLRRLKLTAGIVRLEKPTSHAAPTPRTQSAPSA